ncbi:roadblock/LC7 domain-containing protein [Streptomyces sp. NPDC059688]|uniref:Roadblock/LC7 domain-containing protein n=2 Tax=Streptomyces TaxID=1883 RepID=A0ABV1UFE4_9ACTN|nr:MULTISPECIES: roadblock/LC7 domain-containing protein [unclassified Streptomyces]PKW06543.1 putative regulator of Ras-like GTPase activity (Roadblock/LC7/MglB family) [Streptomyces sp. 5112.2]ROP54482.1 putative regulator of Ras-like GTPase activity (Roadblock/LC7/MglB family) [Streptomyces sp. PanSC9]UXY34695.1 roadblock/LC7 domain-containing protein [Streptomyces sp. HUAS 14-6]SED10544.1 Predicted regulator of Ras-like GTPase activity, Roadblock/LC7/MglB family [Streptomyces sp. 1222.5]
MPGDDHNPEQTDVPAGAPGTDLGWLLDDLVARTDHVRQAVLLTADGLPLSSSDGMRRRDIEHLAAICSGFHGLARSAGERFAAGEVRQTMVMLDDAYLFITPAGHGSRLAVLSEARTDVGQLAHEMALLVRRLGSHLDAAARSGS